MMQGLSVTSSEILAHPAIVKANVALFRGERAEARRYLRDFVDEGGDEGAAVALWIDAQAQDRREDRLERLQLLVMRVGESEHYGRLAARMLEESQANLNHAPHNGAGMGWRLWAGIGAALALVVVIILAINGGQGADVIPEVTQQVMTVATPPTTAIPNRSIALAPEGYSVQYEAGRLTITQVEDQSARVVDFNGVSITPIPGARFYALEVRFECRAGICNDPPEGTLRLRVDNQIVINRREGAAIINGERLAAIARGRDTRGWIVFEIPADAAVDGLLMLPNGALEGANPLFINLVR